MRNILGFLSGVYVLMFFFVSCRDGESQKREIIQSNDSAGARLINVENDSLSLNEGKEIKKDFTSNREAAFFKFIRNFQKRTLPYNLNFANNDWRDFSPSENNEIHRDSAVKYLYGNDSKKVVQPGGGYHRYYYGCRFAFKDSILGLIYYRTSSIDSYSGFILSLYSIQGEKLSEIFLAGTKGEYDIEAQREAQIFKNGSIEVKEIILNKELLRKEGFFDAKIIKSNFEISAANEIIHIGDSIFMHKKVLQDKNRMYSFYEKG